MALKDVGVKLIVEGTGKFKTQMGNANKSLTGLKNNILKHNKAIGLGMTAMGAAIVGVGVASVKAYADMGDEVQKMALRTGFSTERLSELRHAAELSGASIESIDKAVKRMSRSLVEAGRGLETYERSFIALGLNVEEVLKLKPEEQFRVITEALADVEDQTLKSALAQEIFGRSGTELLPLLAQGSEGMAEMAKEAHELGIVFDQEAANKAAKFKDDMTRLGRSFDGIKFKIANVLIPALTPLIEKITKIITKVIAWTKDNPALTKTIVKIAGAVGGLLILLGPLIVMLPQIVAGIALVKAGVIALTQWVRIAAAAQWLWNAALAANPIGLIIIAIVAFGAAVAAAVELIRRHWTKIAVFLKQLWEGIKKVAENVFKGIATVVLAPVVTILQVVRDIANAFRNVAGIGDWARSLTKSIDATLAKISKITFFAEGGVSMGGLAMVGERGPELVSLPPGATVQPINNTTNFNVEANYVDRQEPSTILLDLEALTLAAGR